MPKVGNQSGGSQRPSGTASNDGGGGSRWGRFILRLLGVLLVLVVGFACYLFFLVWQMSQPIIKSDYVDEPVVFSGTLDDVPVPEARARSLGMLMEIYDALSREAGVGDWRPDSGYYTQVWESDLDCGSGGAEEVYNLADASPYVDEEQVLAVVERVAAGYGFEPGSGVEHADADFVRATDQATITLYNKNRYHEEQTNLAVSTGCHRGSYLQDWPTGTEMVPGYLRGKGPDESPQAWPEQTPAAPTPSQGWPTPTYTPVPTGPRPSPTTRQS